MNTNLSEASLAVLEQYRRLPGVQAQHHRNLLQAIQASPLLVEKFNLAVAENKLKGIFVLPENSFAGGLFDSENQAIGLKLSRLGDEAFGENRYAKFQVIGTLGHELEHSLFQERAKQSRDDFIRAVSVKAQQQNGIRDYTDELAARIAVHRIDEARAEIGGFNSVISALRHEKRRVPTFDEIYQAHPHMAKNFIKINNINFKSTYELQPDVKLEPDYTVAFSEQNIEALGRYYFGHSADEARLGASKTSDYTNYYATAAVATVAAYERHYHPNGKEPVYIDMQKLKLDEKLLEENGLYLGKAGGSISYRDVGKHPLGTDGGQTACISGYFDHTADRPRYVVNRLPEAQNCERPAQQAPLRQKSQSNGLTELLSALEDKIDAALDAHKNGDARAFGRCVAQMADCKDVHQMMADAREAAKTEMLLRQQPAVFEENLVSHQTQARSM